MADIQTVLSLGDIMYSIYQDTEDDLVCSECGHVKTHKYSWHVRENVIDSIVIRVLERGGNGWSKGVTVIYNNANYESGLDVGRWNYTTRELAEAECRKREAQ